MSKTAKTILAIALLVLMALAFVFAWLHFSPESVAGEKAITFEVSHTDGEIKSFEISTDAETLRDALEGEGLISGSESQYGLFVTTVDGELADDGARQWWCFTKGGELLNTGVDDTVIADGEHYEAVIDVY